jgi:two-component system phosphate regulon response regulator PhoB
MPLLLVVDDDPDLLTLLSAHYGVRGDEVAVAQSCEAALRLASERRPDVVLLDFCLPRMDGARFIEILRADELTKKTPVVVMSAASAHWVASRLPQDPLIGMIEKPFEFASLDPMIESLLAAAAARP